MDTELKRLIKEYKTEVAHIEKYVEDKGKQTELINVLSLQLVRAILKWHDEWRDPNNTWYRN